MASEIKVDTVSEKTSGSGVTIDGLLIKDGGISGDVSLIGTTPTFTIGDAGAEDAALVFDGNAQDFYIALDDSTDDLVIGLGSAVGTTPMLSFTEAGAVTFKNIGTGDDNPMVITLQTSETDIAADDVIGKIAFQAPDEGTGTDAILVSAAIQAVAEGDHSSSSNATRLEFMTGASEAAASKMTINSDGEVGIGTTNPTSKLHISDNSNYSLKVVKSGSNVHAAQFISNGTASLGIVVDESNNQVRLNSEGSNDSLVLEIADGTDGLIIDSAGHVTKPLQPAFNVNSATMNNLAINTTHTVQFNSERFDTNADFNTSNYTFTAPVTGKYQLQFQINIEGMDEATSYYRFKIATSNEDYNTMLVDPSLYDSDGTWHLVTYCLLADMDANDVSTVEITVTNDGTAQADVSNRSVFSGFLVC